MTSEIKSNLKNFLNHFDGFFKSAGLLIAEIAAWEQLGGKYKIYLLEKLIVLLVNIRWGITSCKSHSVLLHMEVKVC